MLEALHHFVDYDRVLGEIFRVLRPGGRLVSLEPNSLNPIRRASEVRDRLRGTIEKSFYARDLERLCEKAGFTNAKVTAYGSRKSSWKMEEIPAYRRSLAHLHGWLSETFPVVFGALALVAHKAGTLDGGAAEADWITHLRSPVNAEPLRFAEGENRWMETAGGGAFPTFNGIPVLIAADRRTA